MTVRLYLNKDLLREEILASCGPVVITAEELAGCVHWKSGICSLHCLDLIERKIQQAADEALARTLGVEDDGKHQSASRAAQG